MAYFDFTIISHYGVENSCSELIHCEHCEMYPAIGEISYTDDAGYDGADLVCAECAEKALAGKATD